MTPSSLLRIRDGVVAYALDEALAIRLVREDRDVASSPTSPFHRLDRVLAGRGPRQTPDGLRYQDPMALYRAEMEQRRRDGLVN